jgi:hypothetical protein
VWTWPRSSTTSGALATILDGIREGLLVAFRYRWFKDDVDFERIP